MPRTVDDLKAIVQDVLGGLASNSLLAKIESALNEGATTRDGLVQACSRIEKLVNLFIGTDKAQIIAGRFKETLSKYGDKSA